MCLGMRRFWVQSTILVLLVTKNAGLGLGDMRHVKTQGQILSLLLILDYWVFVLIFGINCNFDFWYFLNSYTQQVGVIHLTLVLALSKSKKRNRCLVSTFFMFGPKGPLRLYQLEQCIKHQVLKAYSCACTISWGIFFYFQIDSFYS